MSITQTVIDLIKILEISLQQITNYQHRLDLKNIHNNACKSDGAFSFFNSKYYGSNCQQRNLITSHWVKQPKFIEYIYLEDRSIDQKFLFILLSKLLQKGKLFREFAWIATILFRQFSIQWSYSYLLKWKQFIINHPHIQYWDILDIFSPYILGKSLLNSDSKYHQQVINEWLSNHNMWIVRIAILHQLYYKQKTNLNMLLNSIIYVSQHHLHNKTSYLNKYFYGIAYQDSQAVLRAKNTNRKTDKWFLEKSIGWALRNCTHLSEPDPNLVINWIYQNYLPIKLSKFIIKEALLYILGGQNKKATGIKFNQKKNNLKPSKEKIKQLVLFLNFRTDMI